MIRTISLVTLLVGLSPGIALAQDDDSILNDAHIVTQEYVEAEVLRVNTADRTITVRGAARGQTRTFAVTEDVRVIVNGRPARLRDVRRGDDVQLMMRPRASEVVVAAVQIPETAVPLEARQAEPVAEPAPVVAQVQTNVVAAVQEVRPTTLPRTASALPLILLAGLLSMTGAVILNIRSRAKK